MKFFVCFLIFVSLVLVSSGALADKSEPEIRASIRDAIAQLHPSDTPEWWRGLGPSAQQIIISMYQSSSYNYDRIRLLEGLSAFESQAATDFIENQAAATPNDVIRNTAVRVIGATRGASAIDFLATYLHHSDPNTRLVAVRALGRLSDPRAKTLYAQFLKDEKVSWVVARAQRVQGSVPAPTGTLSITGSEGVRLNPDFAGNWSGYWLMPGKGGKLGSSRVEAKISLDQTALLKGELMLKSRTFHLANVNGGASRVKGQIIEKVPPGFDFVAEVSTQGGAGVLEIRIPRSAATLILRRD